MLQVLKHSDITRRPFARIFAQQCRHRHQPQHRTINVQLLSDVNTLGKLGTIQPVSPGHMRSILYPQGKAAYIVKGVAPQLPPLTHQKSELLHEAEDTAKFEDLKARIEALGPIVFHKRLISSRHPANLTSAENHKPIHGAVTVHDVALRLQENHNLSLTLPDALLSFDMEHYQDRIKSTGLATLFIKLRNGISVSLRILVEPEVDVTKKKVQ